MIEAALARLGRAKYSRPIEEAPKGCLRPILLKK